MRKFKILTPLILGVVCCSFLMQKDYKTRPNEFPNEAIYLIEDSFSNTILLDTIFMKEEGFNEKLKFYENRTGSYNLADHKELKVYYDFIHVKNTITDLSTIQNENNHNLKNNLLFKMKIELKNKPISRVDLDFVYTNWEIIN